MKKAKKRFINNLLYLCLAGIIVIGLMTIIATGGGGDGVSFDYNEPEPDAEIMGIYYVEGDIEGDRVSWTLYEDEYYCLMMEISAYPASDHVMCVWDYYPSSATEPCASDCFDLDEQDAISITYYSCGKFDLEDNYDKYGWHRYEYKITDVDSDIYTFEMEIRPPKGSQGITNGTKTLMVTNPENAFDADPLTYATIPWYWGEAGHNDFLHFVAYVGFNRHSHSIFQ